MRTSLSLAAVRAAGAVAGALLLGSAARRLFAPTGDDESAAPEPEGRPRHEEAALRAVVGDVPGYIAR